MSRPCPVEVVEVRASSTHDLRRRVLREGRPDAEVHWPEDDHPEVFHLAVLAPAGSPVAVATFVPAPVPAPPHGRAPCPPDMPAARLRGMAVEPPWQGRGLGVALLEVGIERLRRGGFEVLWANARDSALDFYRHQGMRTVGEGFLSVGLPHHLVIARLSVADQECSKWAV